MCSLDISILVRTMKRTTQQPHECIKGKNFVVKNALSHHIYITPKPQGYGCSCFQTSSISVPPILSNDLVKLQVGTLCSNCFTGKTTASLSKVHLHKCILEEGQTESCRNLYMLGLQDQGKYHTCLVRGKSEMKCPLSSTPRNSPVSHTNLKVVHPGNQP